MNKREKRQSWLETHLSNERLSILYYVDISRMDGQSWSFLLKVGKIKCKSREKSPILPQNLCDFSWFILKSPLYRVVICSPQVPPPSLIWMICDEENTGRGSIIHLLSSLASSSLLNWQKVATRGGDAGYFNLLPPFATFVCPVGGG